ncbi:hypothetical protein CAEBREN_23638 [Caenorhabditis brenneri]|uniref:Uncharacterized protein n=1 Tax=Caenorhabditis brenneri TaxID=135651 RepID=G0P1M3_CAEBE|nr:hypothetical protein CAEBREN_23638 [Caenorhabditis brenneri]
MEGLRLLFVIGNKLVLHQHRSVSNISRSSSTAPVTFCISDDDLQEKHTWEVIWTQSLPSKPEYLKYSPDGYYLAVAGDKDCFIKVFYQNGTEHSELDFCALTLNHPSPVCGFEWRETGRYMPRKCIAPILMSWCEDRTSRLWKGTPPPEGSIIDLTGEGGGDPLWDRQKPKKFLGEYIRVKETKTKIFNKIREMMPEKHQETDSNPIGLRAQIGKSPSLLEFPTTKDATEQNDVSFYLAATINAETDCLLVPSFTDLNNQKPFCVHWLNNKELVFSVGAEKLLAEAVLLDLDSEYYISANASGDVADHSPDGYRSYGENNRPMSNTSGRKGAGSVSPDSPLFKDILDVKLEILLRQWTKSNDVLFSIHPIDGSLLTWTVEWLDDHFRQPVISYSSRLPGALPTSDSMSLNLKLNTFNPQQQIIAHPVLPLPLPTSKSKAPRLKVEPTMDVLSEVILLEITPVEPLCKNGGVKELARVASSIISRFSLQLPFLRFIACDGGQLIIFQAVLDARGLLLELSNAKTACNNRDTLDNYSDKILRTSSSRCDRAPSFLKQFNVVSTQSPAKPGCVLEVGKIEDVNLNELNLLFLHVFQARIVISDDDEASDNNPMSSVIDRSQSPTFKDKFFIGLVDHKENEDIIMMFFDTEALPGEKGLLRPSSPLAPSMAKLNFDAELVCRQVMPFLEGTRLSNVVPAAGHLSSSYIYPACETPYVLVSFDNDDSVRFWRCIEVTETDSPNKYGWREWHMISENHPSELGVEGEIVKTQPLRATQQMTLRYRTGALESATTAYGSFAV